MSDEPVLLCSDRNGVRTLTLNRPHCKNAINRELWIALADALAAAAPDDTHPVHKLRRLTDVALSLHELPVPTMPKLVGLQQAKRLTLLAETIDAEEAQTLNLVTWVVSAAEIDAFVTGLAERLAAGPTIALAQSKALLNEGADRTLRHTLANEARAQAVNFATADSAEAYAAFAEKREPSFTGRWAVSRSERTDA